jgi:hypothetical protein
MVFQPPIFHDMTENSHAQANPNMESLIGSFAHPTNG